MSDSISGEAPPLNLGETGNSFTITGTTARPDDGAPVRVPPISAWKHTIHECPPLVPVLTEASAGGTWDDVITVPVALALDAPALLDALDGLRSARGFDETACYDNAEDGAALALAEALLRKHGRLP